MKPLTRNENFWAKIAGDPDADRTMEPVTRSEHYMDKIAEKMNEASTEVPAVTASDNGKVLSVVDGAWAAAEGGGGGMLEVTFTWTEDPEVPYGSRPSADKSWEEIQEAYASGRFIYGHDAFIEGESPPTTYDFKGVRFENIEFDDEHIYVLRISHNEDEWAAGVDTYDVTLE